MKKPFAIVTLLALFCANLLGFFPLGNKQLPIANAQSLSYAFTTSANSVEAGSSFSINLGLTNASPQAFYSVSLYLYQGNAIDDTLVASVVPSYNATYSDPVLSGTYNTGYWKASQILSGASLSFKVTYMVSEQAAEGRLKTLGVSPIVSGAPIEEATANKTSDMLIDVEYYTNPLATPEYRKTIRYYVDLPTITQPLSQIASKTLPLVFTESGTATTNVSVLKRDQASSYVDFTLDTKNGNKITWSGPLDLDNEGFLYRVEKLDSYIKLTSTGVISVDGEKLPLLDSQAIIVFKNVKFVSTPVLLRDGIEVSASVQGSGACSTTARTCTYLVEGFSEYKITPSLKVTETPEVGEPNYTMEAFVDDLDAEVKYRIDGEDWVTVQQIDVGTGRFSANLNLVEGLNLIEVTATSANDETDSILVEVTYTPGFVAEEQDDQPERSSFNVVLTILAITMIVVSLVAVAVLWMFVYRKKNQGTKVHTPKKVLTSVISKDKVGKSNTEVKKDETESSVQNRS